MGFDVLFPQSNFILMSVLYSDACLILSIYLAYKKIKRRRMETHTYLVKSDNSFTISPHNLALLEVCLGVRIMFEYLSFFLAMFCLGLIASRKELYF